MAVIFTFSGNVPPAAESDLFYLESGSYVISEDAFGASCDWQLLDAITDELIFDAGTGNPVIGVENEAVEFDLPDSLGPLYIYVEDYMDGGPFNITIEGNDSGGSEWLNIFELSEWDIYIKYVGITGFPNPDSREFIVKASELDPAVGTVTVDPDDGAIICDMENGSGAGGEYPHILLVPVNQELSSATVRVTAGIDGQLIEASSGLEIFAEQVLSISPNSGEEGPEGTYSANSELLEEVPSGTALDNYETSAPVVSGNGIGLRLMRGGF